MCVYSFRSHESVVFTYAEFGSVSSNNGAERTEASFDTMKADKRETGPSRHVGAAN